ncbi:MAG: class I SAM-dependent methyltransferase [Phycisphaerales bacterium]|nr:class I SAM-dependent methyltransferase [Phycisphaerales bacterium]
MRQDTGKVFNELAEGYARYRPRWSDEVITAVASLSRGNTRALEVGCGSGQATSLLASHFEEVIATDPAPAAIERAPAINNVQWAVGTCDSTPAADESVDLIFAAQAAHWFDMDAFSRECRRVGSPEGRVALIGYDLLVIGDEAIDTMLHEFYHDVRGDWDERRGFVDARYTTLEFPFSDLDPPPTPSLQVEWPLEGLLGYLRTWSGVRNQKARTQQDPVAALEGPIRALWGQSPRVITFPVFIRAGEVH